MVLCTEKNRVHTPSGAATLIGARRNLVVNDQDKIGTNRLIPQLNVLPVNKPVIDTCKKDPGLSHGSPILFETHKSKTSRFQY